ncbi:MAG TPA: hypothetical protein PKA88_24290 [Polyangiaceae bacterium]|nr:hypothetical protein [Polyangiaceae bacterium]
MPAFRSTSAALWAFGYTFLVVQAAGCGADAVAVDECRDIESARCEAGVFCGLVDDVAECKRFYRDHCLHGFASGDRPGSPQVKACIATIQAAGRCAKAGTPELSTCTPAVSAKTVHSTACEVILNPEGVQECEFLATPVVLPDAAADALPEAAAPDSAANDAGSD